MKNERGDDNEGHGGEEFENEKLKMKKEEGTPPLLPSGFFIFHFSFFIPPSSACVSAE